MVALWSRCGLVVVGTLLVFLTTWPDLASPQAKKRPTNGSEWRETKKEKRGGGKLADSTFVDGHEDKDQQHRDDGHADNEFRHVGQSCWGFWPGSPRGRSGFGVRILSIL